MQPMSLRHSRCHQASIVDSHGVCQLSFRERVLACAAYEIVREPLRGREIEIERKGGREREEQRQRERERTRERERQRETKRDRERERERARKKQRKRL